MGGIFSAAEVAEVEEQINEFVKNEQPQHLGKKRDNSELPSRGVIGSEVPNIPEDEVRDDPNSIDSGEEVLFRSQANETEKYQGAPKKEMKDYRERMDEFYTSLDKVQQLVAQLKSVKDDTEREKLLAVLRKEKQILLEKKRSGYFMMYKGQNHHSVSATQHDTQQNTTKNFDGDTKQHKSGNGISEQNNKQSNHVDESTQAGSQKSVVLDKDQILEVFGVVNPGLSSSPKENNNNADQARNNVAPSKRAVLANWRNPLFLAGFQPQH